MLTPRNRETVERAALEQDRRRPESSVKHIVESLGKRS